MKFKIVRSKFLEGLKFVQNVVSEKSTLQVIKNVLLEGEGEKIVLTTTDLDISIRATVACEIEEGGVSTLPVKLLADVVSSMCEGVIEVQIDANENAVIRAGRTKFKIAGLPAADFPRLPQDEEAPSYQVEQATLKEMFRKVCYAASQDDTRKTLKSVLMSFKDGKLTLVATDGRRLSKVEAPVDFPVDFERDIVLPLKTVQEVQRLLTGEEPVEIKHQKSQVCFMINSVLLYSKLIDEVYPNYKQIIPTQFKEDIEIDRQSFLEAIERVSVIDKFQSTKLVFGEGKVTILSATTEIGEASDEVPIKYIGEPLEIIFSPTYLIECLKAIDDNTVVLHLNNSHTPGVITCSIPFIYVIMPLRVN